MAAQLEQVKWIPGTRFIVDGFKFPSGKCRHYFLTHAHADHTIGLKKSWNAGTIYCTPVTAKLIIEEQSIPKGIVSVIPLNEPFWLEGVRITALCANHCPGACMLLFQSPIDSPNGSQKFRSILHTGDFRYNSDMPKHPMLMGTNIHTLMLDTTYSTPRWAFPPQHDAVASAVEVVKAAREDSPGTVFAFNAYHIGKERCYFQVASSLGLSIWVSTRRHQTLQRLQLPEEWMSCVTKDKQAADVIVSDTGVGPPQLQELQTELEKPVIGFQCTGWGFSKSGVKKREQDGTLSYSIPYSEHSSFLELRECVKAFRPKKLVPTVNVTDADSFDRMIAKFADLMDLSESRKHIDRFFVPKSPKTDTPVAGMEHSAVFSGWSPEMGGSLKRSVRTLDVEDSQVSQDDCELLQPEEDRWRCLKAWRSEEELHDDVLCEDCSQTVADDVCEIFDM